LTKSTTVTLSVFPPERKKPTRRGRRAADATVEKNYRARLNAHYQLAALGSCFSGILNRAG
jgi:hypothetical protein